MGSVGSVGFLVDFEFSIAVLGVGRVPIGLVAGLRFKWLDSQPDSSNVGPVSIDFHDVRLFRKSCHGFLARYLSYFRPNRLQNGFSIFSVGTKKMRNEKLRRFVVVSRREVPSLTFSCPCKIFFVRPFSKPLRVFLPQSSRKSVH